MQFEQENYNVTEGGLVSMTLLLDNVTNIGLTVTLQATDGTAVGESLYSSE